MRIGLIVEGLGEPAAFAELLPKISTPHEILRRPVRADLQPRATYTTIARSAQTAVRYLRGRAVDLVVVLIDSETELCPENFAVGIRDVFVEMYGGLFEVVAKHRMFENWLIADAEALQHQPARFSVSSNFRSAVAPNRADTVSRPLRLIGSICEKKDYHKSDDPIRIMRHQDPLRVAANSRSFRRLLRVLGCPQYAAQSRNP